jgi:phosphate starvation-inducible PhoH-like protein
LKVIEEAFGIEASARDNRVFLKGDEQSVQKAEKLIMEIHTLTSRGRKINPKELKYALAQIKENGQYTLNEWVEGWISVPAKKRFITPRTRGQCVYIESIKKNTITLCIGPAGTGKSYLAMALAVNALLGKEVTRIVLTRPAIEAGEKLGFLPGDIADKINPYLRPLYDALYDMIEVERANKMIADGIVEIAPLAFMRGRTLNDSFIILDEAQNTTAEQMKMFLTRLGFNSRMIVNGDITQIDLPAEKGSGLIEASRILVNIEGVGFVNLTEKDVVRHVLVQRIIKAYEKYQRNSTR